MRQFLFVLALIGLITTDSTAVWSQEEKTPASAAVVTGVLSSWLALVDGHQTMPFAGKMTLLSNGILPNIKWSGCRIQSDGTIDAKLYNDKKTTLVRLLYTEDYRQKQAKNAVILISSSGTQFSSVDKDYLFLVESKKSPVGIWLDWFSNKSKTPRPGTPVSLSIRQGNLVLRTVNPVITPGKFDEIFYNNVKVLDGKDTENERSVYAQYRAIDAYHIPGADEIVSSELSDQENFETTPVLGLVHLINNQWLIAGENPSDSGWRKMFWKTYSTKTKKWLLVQKHLQPDLLSQLLPSVLRTKHPLYEVPDYSVGCRVWKDGSLILRLAQDISDGLNALHVTALVRQPAQGKPQLLAWCVRHEKIMSNGHDISHETTDLETRKRAFNHVWFIGTSGKIESRLAITPPENDLLFDVDHTNNSIIYLLNGQLYSMDMSNVR